MTAQLTEHARAASGLAMAVVGAAFLLRRSGTSLERRRERRCRGCRRWPGRSRPRPFVDLRWWPLLLSIAVVVGCCRRRRMCCPGGGTSAPGCCRPGWVGRTRRRRCRRRSGWRARQQRTGLIGWGIGLFVFALASGSLSDSVSEAVAENPEMGEVFARQRPGSDRRVLRGHGAVLRVDGRGVRGHLGTAVEVRGTYRSRRGGAGHRRQPTALDHLVAGLHGARLRRAAAGQRARRRSRRGHRRRGRRCGRRGDRRDARLPAGRPGGDRCRCGVVRADGRGCPRWAWFVVAYAFFFGMFGALLDLPDVFANLSPFGHTTAMPLSSHRGRCLSSSSLRSPSS